MTRRNDRITVGIVHSGPETHGISRFSRLLVASLRSRTDIHTVETSLVLSPHFAKNLLRIASVAWALRRCDVVHVQFVYRHAQLWGEGRRARSYLQTLRRLTRGRLVATVHDLLPRYVTAKEPIFAWLAQVFDGVLVCSEEEKRRAAALGLAASRVIPHPAFPFELRDKSTAKKKRSLSGFTVLTLLGFIFQRKGHGLLVEALSLLPPHYAVVFAGDVSRKGERVLAEALLLAERLGVRERVFVTGALSDDAYLDYLSATDVAVCPFETMSASGTLAQWIGARHPRILVSAQPQVAELHRVAPGSLTVFAPYEARPLAQAIESLAAAPVSSGEGALDALRAHLAPERVGAQLAEFYMSLSPR